MEARPGGAAALLATSFLTLFTAGFLVGGGPEYWKFAVFFASVVALAAAAVYLFAPGTLRILRLGTGKVDPGARVPISRIAPFILEAQYLLLSDLPIAKSGSRNSEAHGSAS
jgi:hypothetical protein